MKLGPWKGVLINALKAFVIALLGGIVALNADLAPALQDLASLNIP